MQQIKLQAQEAEAAAFYGNVAVLTATTPSPSVVYCDPFKVKGQVKLATPHKKEAGKGQVVDRLADLPVGIRQVAQAGRFMAPMFKTSATEGLKKLLNTLYKKASQNTRWQRWRMLA